jgi:iron complex transport system substrate-binding protein
VDESNYEAILAAQPDLIMVSSDYVNKEKYEKLSKIAPTLAYDRLQWKSTIVEIGKALDREDKANAFLQAYNDKLKQARETIIRTVGANKTVALMRLYEKEVQLFFPDFDFGSVLYKELGLTPAASITDLRKTAKDPSAIMLSLEKLPDLTADFLFVTAGGSVTPPDGLQKALDTVARVEQLQVWQAIPAVKQNHVYHISARHWMLSGPIADSEKIDDVVKALTGSK